jgi:hypothetical protein
LSDLIKKINSILKIKNNNLKTNKNLKYDLISKTRKYFEQIKEEFNISFFDNDKDNKIFSNISDRIHEIYIKRDNREYHSDLYRDKVWGRKSNITSPIYIYRDLFSGIKSSIICWSIEDIQEFYDKREIILEKIYNKVNS